MDEEQKRKAKEILVNHCDLFASSNPGTTDLVSHQIDTGLNYPTHSAPYRTSLKERTIIQNEVEKMKEANIIRESKSPWAAPVVLVSKKDGSIRFCVDYRKLNLVTTKDVYPLPRIDDCLSTLSKGCWFSTMDLTSGYWQIPVEEGSKHKTAFITADGLYEFNVMPFGLTNSPATFQRFMDATLAGLKWKNLLVYLDDVCVFSSNFDSHLKDLEEVFDRLRKSKLKLKPSKCHFFQNEIKYLGHIITKNGVKPDPDKIKAIIHMPVPTNLTQLQSFLGLIGYYRKFIQSFASKCSCLYQSTRTNKPFIWTTLHQEAFEHLKSFLCQQYFQRIDIHKE